MAPLLAQLHALGRLRQFDNRTFFLFVLLAGCGPFALAPLSEWLLGGDIRAAPAVEQQIGRVLDTLLPLDA